MGGNIKFFKAPTFVMSNFLSLVKLVKSNAASLNLDKDKFKLSKLSNPAKRRGKKSLLWTIISRCLRFGKVLKYLVSPGLSLIGRNYF